MLFLGKAFSGGLAPVNAQTGTTYTLQASDSGGIVTLTNAAAITLTAPATLPAGFNCMIRQGGAGQVGVVVGSGGTFVNDRSQSHLYGQGSMGIIVVDANSGGSAAVVTLSGSTA